MKVLSFFLFGLTLLTSIFSGHFSWAQSADFDASKISKYRPAYLDMGDQANTTVYNRTGFDTETCKSPCEKVGWPGAADTTIATALNNKNEPILRVQRYSDSEGRELARTYRLIHFKYFRKGISKEGVGWIEDTFVSDLPVTPIYGDDEKVPPPPDLAPRPSAKEAPAPKPIDGGCVKNQAEKNISKNKKICDEAIRAHGQEMEKLLEALKPIVGKCPLEKPSKTELNFDGLLYDKHVLPSLKNMSDAQLNALPKLENGKKTLSREELIKIDSLARTVYGEMASCMRSNHAYGMAVAKVALNRESLCIKGNAICNDVFEKPEKQTDADKPKLTKMLMSPAQFSVWNLEQAQPSNKDQNILRVLCPANEVNGSKNFKRGPASAEDKLVWARAMRVAMEAVLNRDDFVKKTSQVVDYEYRTNMMGEGYKKRVPIIEGRRIDSADCMWILYNPKRPLPRPQF